MLSFSNFSDQFALRCLIYKIYYSVLRALESSLSLLLDFDESFKFVEDIVTLLLLRSRKRFCEFNISSRFLSIKLFAFSDNTGDGEYFDIIAELSNN
jgi:hypothetical protein